jgi:hypothetical protein
MTNITTPCPTVETPRAEVIAERSPRSGVWILTVARCPFCSKRHSHGGGSDDAPDLGARNSHCITGPGGSYDLIETAASIAARTLPYGCIGPECAVETGPGQRARCSGCAS